jgi:hypothetical protein
MTRRRYLASLSRRARYLLYCTQVGWPSTEEVLAKLALLETRFVEVARIEVSARLVGRRSLQSAYFQGECVAVIS